MIGARVPEILVVLDIDPRNGGSYEALTVVLGPLPDTLTTWSGRGDGGCHLYFFRPRGELSSRLLPRGIDLKKSGYLIVPPSVHAETGQPYRWEHRPIAELPTLARQALLPSFRSRRPGTAVSGSGRARRAAGLVRVVLDADDGERNNRLYWAARRASDDGHGELLLDELAAGASAVGLSDAEISRTIESARSSHAVSDAL